MFSITAQELESLLLKNPENIELIDVRSTEEFEETHRKEARNIPLHIIPIRMNEINVSKQIIIICRSGARSGQACHFLEGENIKAYNLSGGMNSFESLFPDKVIHGQERNFFSFFS